MDLCCEIQKIPKLVEHFEAHKSCNDDSFVEFLVRDYIGTENDLHGDHDKSDHDDLPFNGTHQCCPISVFDKSEAIYSLEACELKMTTSYGFRSYFYSLEITDSPFQPPKA